MSLRVNTNVHALNIHRNLVANDFTLSKVLEKLASGLKINRAADDAAGLAVSEKLRAQVKGLKVATDNVQSAISLVQTADSGLNEVQSMLQRMRELAVQASSDQLTDTDRSNLQAEINQLISQIDQIGSTTQFNTRKLLSGSFVSSPLTFQVGANTGEVVALTIATVGSNDLSISGLSITSLANASAAIATLDSAISAISARRATLGAFQNRLQYILSNNNIGIENQTVAESRIRDADMAKETIELVRLQILRQTGVASLIQANALPQTILALFR